MPYEVQPRGVLLLLSPLKDEIVHNLECLFGCNVIDYSQTNDREAEHSKQSC